MEYHVSFEAIETYLHRHIYLSYIMGDKCKKTNFQKAYKPFSMLHRQLMYNNTRLVISSTERQHTIINDVQSMIQKLKQWLHTVEGIQRYKIFQIGFSGSISKAMSKDLLRNATNVRSRKT